MDSIKQNERLNSCKIMVDFFFEDRLTAYNNYGHLGLPGAKVASTMERVRREVAY